MPLPDNFSATLYDLAQGRDDQPRAANTNGPTHEDLAALIAAYGAFEVLLGTIARNPWSYDFVATASHAALGLEMADYQATIGHAINEARDALGVVS